LEVFKTLDCFFLIVVFLLNGLWKWPAALVHDAHLVHRKGGYVEGEPLPIEREVWSKFGRHEGNNDARQELCQEIFLVFYPY
jgi:hypothetical protein